MGSVFTGSPLPKPEIAELTAYLLESGQAYRLREDTLIHVRLLNRL